MDAHPDSRRPDRDRLWRLVHDGAGRDDGAGAVPPIQLLENLCRVAVAELDLMGAAVTLPPTPDAHVVAAASDDAARRLQEMQYDTGEGPTLEACRLRLPVLVPDMTSPLASSWPGFTQAAAAAGVAAVHALPLHVGASLLGALTLFGSVARPLARPEVTVALTLAEIAVEMLIDDVLSVDVSEGAGDTLDPFRQAIDGQAHIFQAQGMVMIQLRVSLTEALARMRAHAYAHGLTLDELSTGILDGAITLDERT